MLNGFCDVVGAPGFGRKGASAGEAPGVPPSLQVKHRLEARMNPVGRLHERPAFMRGFVKSSNG